MDYQEEPPWIRHGEMVADAYRCACQGSDRKSSGRLFVRNMAGMVLVHRCTHSAQVGRNGRLPSVPAENLSQTKQTILGWEFQEVHWQKGPVCEQTIIECEAHVCSNTITGVLLY